MTWTYGDLHQNDEEQTTINDLIDSMKTYLGESGSMPYSFTYMKQKIQDHYGDSIIIAEINGKSNVVTFTARACKILCDFHEQSKRDDSIRGKKRLIEAAAKLIKSDIKSIILYKAYFRTSEEMSIEKALNFIPESLHMFLQVVFPTKNASKKIASLGQAIIPATRPRV